MTSNRYGILFTLFFIVGLGVIVGAYWLLVPEASKTDISMLNLAVVIILYISSCAFYSMLYTPVRAFGTQAPLLGIYTYSCTIYAVLAIAAMLACYVCEAPFRWQLVLQAVLLFMFVTSVLIGYWARRKVVDSTAAIHQAMDGVRAIQRLTKELAMQSESLPPEYNEARRKINTIADDANYLSGALSEDARKLEEEILTRLTEVKGYLSNNVAPKSVESTLSRLGELFRLRRL